MKKISIALLLFSLLWFVSSCEKDEPGDPCVPDLLITSNSSETEDNAVLNQLLKDILAMANASSCSKSDQWGITAIGSKPCGGPTGYIPYRTDVDVACFLKKVNHYSEQMEKFNKKYQRISDCMVEPEPKAVVCEDGKPVLMY
jgi:hypothetical protein